jgi:hypothetical protein
LFGTLGVDATGLAPAEQVGIIDTVLTSGEQHTEERT